MIRLALLALCLSASQALAADDPAPPSTPRPVVSEIVAPHAGLASSWVGTVTAKREIDLGFLRLGTLAERSVDVGDLVTTGEVLAQLDSDDLLSELRSAEAGVSIAEANVETARDAFDRASTLSDRDVASTSVVEDRQNARASAEATLEQARAAEARAADALSDAELKSPIDGVVTEVLAQPGATVSAGDAVLRVAATEGREVVIAATEEDAATLDTGASFDVTLIANPDITATATLSRIDPVSARETRTRAAHLTLDPEASQAFRLGALVIASRAASGGQVFTLPVSALIADSDPPAVWRVTPDRHVERVEVRTGPRAGGRVAILGGLADGDEVVTRGVNSIEAGQEVGARQTLRGIGE